MRLAEVVPTYLDTNDWNRFRYAERKDANDHPLGEFDWLYFGASFDVTSPPPLLIASPHAFPIAKPNKRVVVLGDFSAAIVQEEEYQELLRKTIEAMHQRAGTSPAPATEAPPASPDGATAPADRKTPEATDDKPNIR